MPADLTALLDELERLEAEATAGPWLIEGGYAVADDGLPYVRGYSNTTYVGEHEPDAKLIVALRNNCRNLIRLARAAGKMREGAAGTAESKFARLEEAERDRDFFDAERIKVVAALTEAEELRDNAMARLAELTRFAELVARMGAFGGTSPYLRDEARRILAGKPVEVSPGAVAAAEELMGEADLIPVEYVPGVGLVDKEQGPDCFECGRSAAQGGCREDCPDHPENWRRAREHMSTELEPDDHAGDLTTMTAERDALAAFARAWHFAEVSASDAYDALPEALRRRVEG